MSRITTIDHLLGILHTHIFTALDSRVPLKFRRAEDADRAAALSDARNDWTEVTPDLVWGEPDGYFWFAGTAVVPEAAAGMRLYLHVDAQFGSTMGRSDPQCLVRVNGDIVQGVDGNHREVLLTADAVPGASFEIVIEAGTIEDRRQLGFACRLMVHDPVAEDVFYDLSVPMDVARLLAEDDPRRHFIIEHVDAALKAIDFRPGDAHRFAASLETAKAAAANIFAAQDFAEKPVITVTGHTHIDVAWLWRVRETRQKMARSMATALALMDEYPDYRFMYNQGVLLDYLGTDYPELFARITDKVAAGQFEIEGALWLEPDANITSGESFVRHILHGVHYHEKTFGVRPRILWLPDTFGYSAALPQLMRRSGLDVFVTHKMSWNDTNRMPYDTFFWQGIDGTKVPAYFLTTQPYTSPSIGTTYCPDLKPTHVMGTWRRHGQQAQNHEIFLVYGHGDGGGGPTREMLENVRRMEKGIPGCPAVRHEHMRPFFERLLARMAENPGAYPTWVGELYLEFHRGTLTSVARNKRNNRLAESALREVEALATLAMVSAGHPYPHQKLHDLWRIVLLNQFHDILPGSSIGAVFKDSDRDYAAFFEGVAGLKLELAGALGSEGGHLAFNVLGRPRSGMLMLPGATPQAVTIGKRELASQSVWRADGSAAQIVPIADLPALGVQEFALAHGPAATADASELSASTTHLENATLKVRFDEKGRLASVLDKRSQRELLKQDMPANRLQAFRDMPPQFDAWDIAADFEEQVWEIDDLVSAEVTETGPYRAAIRLEWAYESSTIVQVVALEAGAARLDIDGFIDWHEHHTMVKAAFPIDVATDKVTAEIQFGHVMRPTHRNTSWDQARFETLMHRWVDISEPGFGAALLNDCKYGYDARDTTVRLTLLRSPTYPWPEADQGEHRFRYGLLVHHGTFEGKGVPAAAEEFNLPVDVLSGTGEALPAETQSLLEVDPGVTVESIKRAEDNDDIVVRLRETCGQTVTTAVRLPKSHGRVAETDLLECDAAPLSVENGRVMLTLAPFDIRTLRLARD